MQDREVRRRWRRLLGDLELTVPLDVEQLCERYGSRRGRPVRLVAHPMQVPGPTGCWIATPNVDYVIYQEETTRSHQDHIVLHELGHIEAGHRGNQADAPLFGPLQTSLSTSHMRARYPDLAPELVRRALGRCGYAAAQERHAEIVATVVKEWAMALAGRQRLAAARTWSWRRQAYLRLGPLWRELHRTFPELALDPAPGAWREHLALTGLHRRYYRRAVECRDGLLRLSPHVGSHSREVSGTVGRSLSATELRTALAMARKTGTDPRAATLVAARRDSTLDDDVLRLVALSDALRARA